MSNLASFRRLYEMPRVLIFLIIAAGSITCEIWFVFSCAMLPMVDLPKWQYQASLLVLAILRKLPSAFHAMPAPVPNSASIFLIGTLSLVFTNETATRITATITILIFIFGSSYLLGAGGALLGEAIFYLPLILLPTHFFYSGELSYLMGLGFGFIYLGYLIRRYRQPETLNQSLMATLLIATFFSSLVALAPTIAIASVLVLVWNWRRMPTILLSLLLPTLLTIWYVLARWHLGGVGRLWTWWSIPMFAGVSIDVFAPFQTFAPWMDRTSALSHTIAVLNISFCLSLVVMLLYAIWVWINTRRDTALLLAGVIALIAASSMRELAGASLGERFLFPGFFIGCVWLSANASLKPSLRNALVAAEIIVIVLQGVYLRWVMLPVTQHLQQSQTHLASLTTDSQFTAECRSLGENSWPTAHGDWLGHFLPNNPVGTLIIYKNCIAQNAVAPLRPDGLFYLKPLGNFYDQCAWTQCLPELSNSKEPLH
jgi:hypothetical protein